MEQPEVFKNFKDSWTNQDNIYDYDVEELKDFKKKIKELNKKCKILEKRIGLREDEKQEVLKYFNYLDSLHK